MAWGWKIPCLLHALQFTWTHPKERNKFHKKTTIRKLSWCIIMGFYEEKHPIQTTSKRTDTCIHRVQWGGAGKCLLLVSTFSAILFVELIHIGLVTIVYSLIILAFPDKLSSTSYTMNQKKEKQTKQNKTARRKWGRHHRIFTIPASLP